MHGLKKRIHFLTLIVFLLYATSFLTRLKLINQLGNELFFISFSVIGLIYFFKYLYKNNLKLRKIDTYIIAITFVIPVINAYIAQKNFGQPFLYGLLSWRGILLIYFSYFLLDTSISQFKLLNAVNIISIIIVATAFILFFVFKINDSNFSLVKGTVEVESSLNTIKKDTFSGYTFFLNISYIAGWFYFFKTKRKIHLILPIITFLLVFFVSKSRNELLLQILIPIIIYFKHSNISKLKIIYISGIFAALCLVIFLSKSTSGGYFSIINNAFNEDYARETGDFSAYMRIKEILIALEWFVKFKLFGIGNLSYQYNGGYLYYIDSYFYVADIGLFGILIKGGITLLLLYFSFYHYMFNKLKKKIGKLGLANYLLLFVILELFIGNDFLYFFPGFFTLVLIFYNYQIKLAR